MRTVLNKISKLKRSQILKSKIALKLKRITSENIFLSHVDHYIEEAEHNVRLAQEKLADIHAHKINAPTVIAEAEKQVEQYRRALRHANPQKVTDKIAALKAKIDRLEKELQHGTA